MALRALVDEARRAEAAQRRRRARWEAQAAIAATSVASALASARSAGAPATVRLAGATRIDAVRVDALGPDAAVLALGDGTAAIVVLVAIEVVEVAHGDAAPGARRRGGPPPDEGTPPPLDGARLPAVLDALAPLPVQVTMRSGAPVQGRLLGAGDGVAVVEGATRERITVAIDAIVLVRLGRGW